MWMQYRQPDGTTLAVRYCGDEHFTYYLSPTGVPMIVDGNGFLRPITLVQLERDRAEARADEPAGPRRSRVKTSWDPAKVYPSPVILVSYADQSFSVADDPKAFYDSLFNDPGFNKGVGPGCVADYFRDQSQGLFNARFDIYGPVQMPDTARCYSKDKGGSGTYKTVLRNALVKAVDSLGIDLSPYDWDGDGAVEQVVFIYAGYGGNDSYSPKKGVIHPHTSTLSAYTSGGVKTNWYTCSAEMWGYNKSSCGIGTICHEFSHSLGLPDLYPTSGSEYSVLDEWDLMDGGNFINWGWCPPNYSSMEKMLLGWLKPVELTERATITDMKAVEDGGAVYQVSHTDNEYFLLENRQQHGWDLGLPGKGLAVFRALYNESAWHITGDGGSNSVNNVGTRHRYELVHADSMDYAASRAWVVKTIGHQYAGGATRLNSYILSGSAYPHVTDTLENRELTATSAPSATVYDGVAADSVAVLDKPITNIQMTGDGLISFDFMGGELSGIADAQVRGDAARGAVFDLQGRRVSVPRRGVLYIRNGKKFVQL